jgi:hypothetical protein
MFDRRATLLDTLRFWNRFAADTALPSDKLRFGQRNL